MNPCPLPPLSAGIPSGLNWCRTCACCHSLHEFTSPVVSRLYFLWNHSSPLTHTILLPSISAWLPEAWGQGRQRVELFDKDISRTTHPTLSFSAHCPVVGLCVSSHDQAVESKQVSGVPASHGLCSSACLLVPVLRSCLGFSQ